MTIKELLSKLRSRNSERANTADSRYRDLVATIAADKKQPTADAVEDILADASKSVTDLEADIEAAIQHTADLTLVPQESETIAAVKANRLALERAEATLTISRQKALDAYQATSAKLASEVDQLRARLDEITQAKRRIADCSHNRAIDLQDELDALEAREKQLAKDAVSGRQTAGDLANIKIRRAAIEQEISVLA